MGSEDGDKAAVTAARPLEEAGRLQHKGCCSHKVRTQWLPSRTAYLRAVGLGHMAQHEERDVEEKGPNRGGLGWEEQTDLRELKPERKAGALSAWGLSPCLL